MTHASLCTGIGACELASTWMRWENLFSCEVDEFCNRVLKHHYPKAKHYGNIFEQDFREWRGRVDVLTAGFPCQPFSFAGKRNGAEDDRYLWPEVLRVIKEVRPACLLVRTLLESSRWYSPARRLRWEVTRTFAERVTRCTRSVNGTLSSKLDSTSRQSDIQSSQLLYRLVPSERPTGETAFGSLLPTIQTQGMKVCDRNGKTRFVDLSLLPTPAAQDFKRRGPNSKQQGLPEAAYNGMLPTPQNRDFKNGSTVESGRIKRKMEQGWTIDLNDLAASNLLPTPQSRDYKGISIAESKRQRGLSTTFGVSLPDYVNQMLPTPNASEATKYTKKYNPNSQIGQSLTVLVVNGMIEGVSQSQTGKSSQLNPLFVEEMMGYPEDYLVSPFLNGDNNQ